MRLNTRRTNSIFSKLILRGGSLLLGCLLIFIIGCSRADKDKELIPPEQEAILPQAQEEPVQESSGLMLLDENKFYIYYDKDSEANHFIPSGWMGDYSDLQFSDQETEQYLSGKTSIKVTYSAQKTRKQGWAGIYWQSVKNNWGNESTGFDLSKFNVLKFSVRGQKGKEIISLAKVGGIRRNLQGKDVLFSDTTEVNYGPIILTQEWQEYSIPLASKDLSYINGGFALIFSTAHSQEEITIYIDDIFYAYDPDLKKAPDEVIFPFYVYSDAASSDNHFIPSGWIPETSPEDINLDVNSDQDPFSGKTCTKVTYQNNSGSAWAGVYWQNPANNWGAIRDAGYNLKGANKLVFWARGQDGGEKIYEVKAGGLSSGEYPDSDSVKFGPIVLSSEWTRYEIDLAQKDLSYIIGGFSFILKSDSEEILSEQVIYFDDIHYTYDPRIFEIPLVYRPYPPEITKDGRQIKSTSEGGYVLYIQGEPFLVKGVIYNPTPIGKGYDYNFFTDPAKPWLVDGRLMKEAGINCVRVYSAGDDLEATRQFIREMYEKFGIYTIVGDWLGLWDYPRANYSNERFKQETKEEVLKMVETLKDEEGLLMWILGNENNYTFSGRIGFWTSPEIEAIKDLRKRQIRRAEIYYSFVNELAGQIKKIDKKHFVALGNGEKDYLQTAAEYCPNIDILAIIFYRGKTFGNNINDIRNLFDRPVLISEFGCDSYDAYKEQDAQPIQSEFIISQWKDLYANTVFSRNLAGNAIGGCVFEWNDEWWKHNEGYAQGWLVHNPEAGWSHGSYFFDIKAKNNQNMNEEWFGLVSITKEVENSINKRIPKESYYSLKEFFSGLELTFPE